MKISATVRNGNGHNEIELSTNGRLSALSIPPRTTGFGSSANGGELLFLASATCYVNDIYREAEKRKITISEVEVEVSGEFGAEGEGAQGIVYTASVSADADKEALIELMKHTDDVAEIHNTLRNKTEVRLAKANGSVF